MGLLAAAVVSGLAVGLLYGLFALSIVILYKSTGVANFAQGNMATLFAFIVYFLAQYTGGQMGIGLLAVLAVGVVISAVGGVAIYLLTLRIRDSAGGLNLTIRTLALYLLIFALINRYWTGGQPYRFPQLVQAGAANVFGAQVAYTTFEVLVASMVFAAAFVWFFRRTRLGLLLTGLAESAETARLLGVSSRRMTAVAWAMASVVALFVGVLTAQSDLLFVEMMDLFLLYAFASAIIGGGLTSLPGAFLGGAIVGVIVNVAAVYGGSDFSILTVFVVLVVLLLVRPHGLLGEATVERF